MIDHEAAILNDFDASIGKYFGGGIVANPGLKPDGFRLLCQNIFDVRRNVLRSAKHVYEIDIDRNVDEPAIDLFTEYSRRVRVVNRHRNDLKTGVLKISWDVECRLAGLSLSFDSKHRDRLCRVQQVAKLVTSRQYVLPPIH